MIFKEGETVADLIQRYVARYGDDSGKFRLEILCFVHSLIQEPRPGRE
jgi:hypothetical protein